jgi:hypothetical protein
MSIVVGYSILYLTLHNVGKGNHVLLMNANIPKIIAPITIVRIAKMTNLRVRGE